MTSPALLVEARRTLAELRATQDGRDDRLVSLPAEAQRELNRRAALGACDLAIQILPLNAAGWDPSDFQHVVWREAARDGLTVKRIYLLPHRGIADNRVDHHVALDREAGIDPRFVYVSNLATSAIGDISEEIWVVDDATVVRRRGQGSDGDSRWTVSSRPSDLEIAQQRWDLLIDVSETQRSDNDRLKLEEPLVLSADVINEVAPVLCTHNHVDEKACDWYHGAWQYLRLMDMVSTPTWHHDFYNSALRKVMDETPDPSVLITGTADYSMLAYVQGALGTAPRRKPVHVLDLCPTPLFACRWYANRTGRPVVTLNEDLFARKFDERYDVVCTDAFITRFAGTATDAVIAAWRDALKPGGWLITTARVHSRSPRALDAEDAVQDFRDRARQRAATWRPFLRRTPEQIADLAETYARRMVSNDLGSEDHIVSALRNGGMTIVEARLQPVPGEMGPTTYLELVCKSEADQCPQNS
jgi:hypothetical protein